MPEWTFITKHAIVLSFLAKQPLITAREVAASIGTTERAVRRVIADLYIEGYITKKKVGRRVKYGINPHLKLRHHAHRDIAISDLLKALGWKQRQRKPEADTSNDTGT